MENQSLTILIPAEEMRSRFDDVLIRNGFTKETARDLAEGFTNNSVDGVYTHGVNRFQRFIEYVNKGYVRKNANPSLKNKFNGIEQWDGDLGPGILNAAFATEQSMRLAEENGIGCVGLSNTNHWMRGGAYGWQAAKAGYVFIGWTNTIANMPAWGATDARLGNNPLVIAIPYEEDAIVLDMAMSQYSFGAMELSMMKNEKLSVHGGFDIEGHLTDDPAAILESRRPVPIGYWKGAGLSLLLDLLAAILSGGLTTQEISKQPAEFGLSQVFIAFNIKKLPGHSQIAKLIGDVISDCRRSVLATQGSSISYPGERVLQTRNRNLQNGIPVVKQVWNDILKL